MGVKARLKRWLLRLSEALGLERLPTRFNGHWIWVPRALWKGPNHRYEPFVARIMERTLSPGDCMLDVGAHFGLWSLFARRLVGNSGSVVSFEPSPAYDVLLKSTRRYPQIQAVRKGMGSKDERMSFFHQGTATSGSFVHSVTEINQPYAPEVPIEKSETEICRLDSFLGSLAKSPRLIKVDVEGFEVEVLKGATRWLSEGNSTWVIEVHPLQLERSGSSPAEVREILRRHGYQVESIDAPPGLPETIVASRSKTHLL